jgi:hypothetical protein
MTNRVVVPAGDSELLHQYRSLAFNKAGSVEYTPEILPNGMRNRVGGSCNTSSAWLEGVTLDPILCFAIKS